MERKTYKTYDQIFEEVQQEYRFGGRDSEDILNETIKRYRNEVSEEMAFMQGEIDRLKALVFITEQNDKALKYLENSQSVNGRCIELCSNYPHCKPCGQM